MTPQHSTCRWVFQMSKMIMFTRHLLEMHKDQSCVPRRDPLPHPNYHKSTVKSASFAEQQCVTIN